MAATLLGSCASVPHAPPPASPAQTKRSELDLQAKVMKLADDYTALLGEAMQPIIASDQCDPTARGLAQSFLRNGMGSAIDIAAGPNPDASILDLLVLVSLQRWAFTKHWVPLGIPEPFAGAAAARMEHAEAFIWNSASDVLTDQQQATLRSLIEAWIKANPDRRLVSFVRFEQFTDIRNDQTLTDRSRAEGLFREVTDATGAVDQARLLGERALWYASRYPFVLGRQAEVTLNRAIDQPEIRSALEAVESIKKISAALATRIESLDRDLAAQEDRVFDKVAAERTALIEQSKVALADAARDVLNDLDGRINAAREAAVNQSFDRLSKERKDLLDDLESRQETLRGMMTELRAAIDASTKLANELSGTAGAVDHLVARFDRDPALGQPPLRFTDITEAATQAAKAAEKLTTLVDQTNKLASSGVWDERLSRLDQSTAGLADRLFWRALIVVGVLLAGQALLRRIPQRVQAGSPPRAS